MCNLVEATSDDHERSREIMSSWLGSRRIVGRLKQVLVLALACDHLVVVTFQRANLERIANHIANCLEMLVDVKITSRTVAKYSLKQDLRSIRSIL